jgi:hypothetical protein
MRDDEPRLVWMGPAGNQVLSHRVRLFSLVPLIHHGIGTDPTYKSCIRMERFVKPQS